MEEFTLPGARAKCRRALTLTGILSNYRLSSLKSSILPAVSSMSLSSTQWGSGARLAQGLFGESFFGYLAWQIVPGLFKAYKADGNG